MIDFQVGDTVYLRKHITVEEVYGGLTFLPKMAPMIGKQLTIKRIDSVLGKLYYKFKEDPENFSYSYEMLLPVRELDQREVGSIRNFSTGAVRDTAEGKPRMGLLPLDLLKRVAKHYQIGAEKYEPDNWRKGQPKDATMDSLLRHLESYRRGETDEDHLSAVVWNALSMMHVDEYLLREHPELDFGYKYPKKEL